MVGKTSDSVLDHLQTSGQSADVNILGRKQRFDSPHAIQETLPGDIGRVSAKQRRRGVRMRVDQARQHDLARSVQCPLGSVLGRQILAAAHFRDTTSHNAQCVIVVNTLDRVDQQPPRH